MHWLDLFVAWLAVSPLVFGFMFGGCPCCIQACPFAAGCDDCGIAGSIDIDLGAGGWTDDLCTNCTTISGVYTLTKGVSNPCTWTYNDGTACSFPFAACVGCPDSSNKQFTISATIGNFSGTCKWSAILRYAGWGPAPGCICRDSQTNWLDTRTCTGTISLPKTTETHDGTRSPCAGTMPDPIDLILP